MLNFTTTQLIVYTLITTHITIMCVTIFLHRGQAHKGLEFHPILSHFMRLWLWLTTGITTKKWVAIHRKHHRYSDKEHDPHSPHVYGIKHVFFGGYWLYIKEGKNLATLAQYGKGTPNDWIEKNVYSHDRIGILLMLLINLVLFGYVGVLVWLVQMLWIPLWAAGVINGIGHYWGYKNGVTKDHSKNIVPWGVIVGGEELHNNHHLDPASPKFSRRRFEFDIGWLYIKLFESVRLLTIKKAK